MILSTVYKVSCDSVAFDCCFSVVMGRKRKRGGDIQHERDQIEPPPSYDLTKPKEENAHLYVNKNELPWDLEP